MAGGQGALEGRVVDAAQLLLEAAAFVPVRVGLRFMRRAFPASKPAVSTRLPLLPVSATDTNQPTANTNQRPRP